MKKKKCLGCNLNMYMNNEEEIQLCDTCNDGDNLYRFGYIDEDDYLMSTT
jgi:hypothetical protein